MIQVLLTSGIIIGVLLIISLVIKQPSERVKLFLFWGMVLPIIFTTVYLAADTVAKNQSSITGGPVHWHADFEIWNCGQAVDLVDPAGISNRIGSSDFHEHGDNRIHVEGVVKELADVNLGKFFEVLGGQLTNTLLRLPTDHGETILQNSLPCPDGSLGTLQVFLFQTIDQTVLQKKLENFPDYVISPHSTVPPGDCLIIEFGPVREKTDKICDFYEIAIENGELNYVK